MKKRTKAAPGSRQRAALQAIRVFETQQRDWTSADLGQALGISSQQAFALTCVLASKGHLVQTETIVRKRRLMLAPADIAAAA